MTRIRVILFRGAVVLWVCLLGIWNCSKHSLGPNQVPVAIAGPDQHNKKDDKVFLDGSRSFDPDGDELLYQWTLWAVPPGSSSALLDPRGEKTSLVADVVGVWMVSLQVSDGRLFSEPDVLQLWVSAKSCENNADCNDNNICTDDSCGIDKICENVNNTDSCDNSVYCDGTDECDGQGNCIHSGNPCDGECNLCLEPEKKCQPKPVETSCVADAYPCTRDHCDGQGKCLHQEIDANCPAQEICRPDCFDALSGCGPSPATVQLTCSPLLVNLYSSDSTLCTFELGITGQLEKCLSCNVVGGEELLDHTDFDDGQGGCSLNGWALKPSIGNYCVDSIQNCFEGNRNRSCCDQLEKICIEYQGDYALQQDKAFDCGPVGEEWRIEKEFDFTGWRNISMGFNWADHRADDQDGLIAYASSGSNYAQIFCRNGGPRENVDDVFYPTLSDILPSWADNNPDVRLGFVAHSEGDERIIVLDDISVRGWSAGCETSQAVPVKLFEEKFEDCTLGEWQKSGNFQCPGLFSCVDSGASLGSDPNDTGGKWTLEREFQVEPNTHDYRLCWDLGDNGINDSNDYFLVECHSRAGWQMIWGQTTEMGPDSTCANICVNLSDTVSDFEKNSFFQIRFNMANDSKANQMVLDNIVLWASRDCDLSEQVTMDAISDKGDGSYQFTATDASGKPLHADIQCQWAEQTAVSEIDFQEHGSLKFFQDDLVQAHPVSASKFTVEAWVNFDSEQPGAGNLGRLGIVEQTDPNSLKDGSGFGLGLGVVGAGWVLSANLGDEYNATLGTLQLKPGEWNHLAITYDGSMLRLFVNGNQENIRYYGVAMSLPGQADRLEIGSSIDAGDPEFFSGFVDEVRIWNTDLTLQMLNANLFKELVGNESGLIGYWKFNEDSGQVAEDSSSINNHGTLGQLQTPDSADPHWSAAKPF